MIFERKQAVVLRDRLDEAPTYLIVITGPRQIGKTCLVEHVLASRKSHHWRYIATDRPVEFSTLDQNEDGAIQILPGTQPGAKWLVEQWIAARAEAKTLREDERFILVIDEIQKIPQWSETVKGLWDQDRAAKLNMHVILLGSSPWLMQKGLTESLAGRFESIRMAHWSCSEMQAAFDFSLDEYIYFGGYPGGASLIRDERRWRDYIRGSLIQPTVEKDILQMTRVDKPALLKNTFELGCQYSGQIISYDKLRGQLENAGNTTTLAHYLNLFTQAGLLTALSKYARQAHRQRASSPKLNVFNTALISALTGYTFDEARADRSYWGRLIESAVGAHLLNTASDNCQVQYWREGADEVDFILTNGRKHVAIEVKSGMNYTVPNGLNVFASQYEKTQRLVVGENHIPLAKFLSHTADEWLVGIE